MTASDSLWWCEVLQHTAQPTAVFLHGWGQDHSAMLPLARQLGLGGYIFDLPGFGKSPIPDHAWGIADYAHSLHQQILTLGIDRVLLIGHSFGGRIAIKYASLYPESLAAVVLLAPAGLTSPELPGRALLRSAAKLPAKLLQYCGNNSAAEAYLQWWRSRYGSQDYRAAGAMRAILVKAVTEDLSLDAQKIRVPAIIMVGDNDRQAPPQISARLAKLIAHSTMYQLDGLDHYSLLLEGRFIVAHKIYGFLHG